MANEAHLNLLKSGVENWNNWRKRSIENYPDLIGADLSGANFVGANLSWATLIKANFCRANLIGADFSGANLMLADLSGSNLCGASLAGANLGMTKLIGADLSGADLCGAKINNTNLTKAILTGCFVYGASVWDLTLSDAIQDGLIITPKHIKSPITVDNLEVAQFVYLLLNNSKLRDVINTMTGKAVLLLGRFGEGRKAILDVMADWLREKDILPIIMDFGQPDNKDFTETVRTLAGLCKYIIADLTFPQSIPHEIAQIVPTLEMPFVPIIQEGQNEYSMHKDYSKYHWLLHVVKYKDAENLIEIMQEKIIDPAEKMHAEIEARKKA